MEPEGLTRKKQSSLDVMNTFNTNQQVAETLLTATKSGLKHIAAFLAFDANCEHLKEEGEAAASNNGPKSCLRPNELHEFT